MFVVVVLGSVVEKFFGFGVGRVLLDEDVEGDLARVGLVGVFSFEGVLDGAIAPKVQKCGVFLPASG